jgi:hypothetical protein
MVLEAVGLYRDSVLGPRAVDAVRPDSMLWCRDRKSTLPQKPGQLHLEP